MMLVAARFPAQRSSVTAARHFCVGYLARTGHQSVIEPAALAVSELVANAVLHAEGEVEVVVEPGPEVVRIAVHDDSLDEPVVRTPSPSDACGRGMIIVDRVAARWGVDQLDRGKRVWVDLQPATAASVSV